eukprot:GEMP01078870.1.p1 GENE.GEMP01078870.1~~GEMP01078870.1.p1  ORF type:complete len:301 (+),score=65.21 GEMP01078870.1:123-1025(+)
MSASKLFVGCIPNYVTDEMLKEKFAENGEISEFFYMRDQILTDKGWAFITYADDTEAGLAIAMLHGHKAFGGQPRELQVKLASEKITELAGTAFDPKWAPTEAITPWEELRTEDTPPKAYYYNHITEETVWERPAIMNERPVVAAGGVLGASQGTSAVTGPPGANLFIYGIPAAWTDFDLQAKFKDFGQMLAAKIYIDPNTQLSKGFGFVSYTTLGAATTAIEHMHGHDLGEGKYLRVSIKKGEENENPDAIAMVAQKALQMPRGSLAGLASLTPGAGGANAPHGLDAALNAISACYNKS